MILKSGLSAIAKGTRLVWARLQGGCSTLPESTSSIWNSVVKLRKLPQDHGPSARSQGSRLPELPEPVERVDISSSPVDGQYVFYAVGDIHGRADLVRSLIAKIEEDSSAYAARARIIFLGDYFDRGLESKQVVDFLLDDAVQKFEPIFIKGNHEEALLNFLEDAQQGPYWARFGGRETLVSYGVRPPRSLSFNDEWTRAHNDFKDAFPHAHMMFLRKLKASARIGKFGFAHAGMRPGVPFDEQSEKDLLWIRDEFLKSKAEIDVYLIHGHTPVDQATMEKNRINVDTGAYYSGRLTAVRLAGDDISFISTRP